jgi:hypothetical protein
MYSPADRKPFPPKKRIYTGQIEIGSQPHTWITKHRSFASQEWLESQIAYGEWMPERSRQDQFLIYATVIEGNKPLTILIKIRMFDTHAFVYHAHVLRKK